MQIKTKMKLDKQSDLQGILQKYVNDVSLLCLKY